MKRIFGLLLFMTSICWGGTSLDLLIGDAEINQRLDEVACKIDQEYQGEELTVLMVMKGAICVTADLIRRLHVPVTLEYVRASSYGANGTSRGELTVVGLDGLDLTDKNVLVVDDIFDSGSTMTTLMSRVHDKKPRNLKSFVLLVKDVARQTAYLPDYALFKIEDKFVVGYGLDYKENYRGLPGIYCLNLSQ
jgi:hypoxanthine phosphoribosyltransferase